MVTLPAGINLLTGKVRALVRDRHRSREFIAFLKVLDAAYPAHAADPFDSRSSFGAHLQGDASMACRPACRPLRAPKHGSWLNLVEGFFSSSPVRGCATSASHQSKNSGS
jgi:hypothetical protein